MSYDSAGVSRLAPSGNSQRVEAKRNRVHAKRVPSYLTPDRQRQAVCDVRAGRFVHHVARECGCSEAVILELCQRDLERRIREFAASLTAKIEAVDADLRGPAPARKAVA